MKDVLISTTNGAVTVQANIVKGGLAVHRSYASLDKTSPKKEGIYTVTHLHSGLSCYPSSVNYRQACKLLDMLLALDVDWKQDKEHITTHKDVIVKCLRDFGRLKDND